MVDVTACYATPACIRVRLGVPMIPLNQIIITLMHFIIYQNVCINTFAKDLEDSTGAEYRLHDRLLLANSSFA